MNLAIAYLAIVNLAAFVAMGWDKARARRGDQRISERTLLILAAAGGSIGAVTAQQAFRHKTRKQPFGAWLLAITTLELTLVAILVAAHGPARAVS